MTSVKSFRFNLLILIGLVVIMASAVQADWPTYRHDKARSGYTSESLGAPLRLGWVYTSAHPPRPAWSGPAKRAREGFKQRHRVIFDDAFQVAAVDGAVYFGSSSDNKVYAFDAATGLERWSFYTGGPVRLSPMVHKGRVLVGSDDGYLYCLNAKNGEVIWKVHPGPNDERLLGNGNMISRWPIRTSALIDDDIVYFTAGIFPHENVYIYAVRLKDGSVVWKNDTISEAEAYRNEFTPQGYLLAGGKQLFIPSGRALPVGFNRDTGRVAFRSNYGWRGEQAGGLVGGTYALLADNQIYTGTQNHMLALDQNTGRVGFGWFPGRRLAVVGDLAYMATGDKIIAMDRTKYAVASRKRNSLEFKLKGLRRSNKKEQLTAAQKELDKLYRENITPTIKWSVASSCDAELILCENLVFAGGQGQVNAFNRETGEAVWDAKVDGKARGLAIADGRLIVSTDTGRVYCFASPESVKSKGLAQRPSEPPATNPYPEDELTSLYQAAAEAIIMESGVKKGYCLVVGGEEGRLAWELAKRTELAIVMVEPDAKKVIAARKALSSAGLYGHRVIVEQRKLSDLPYSNYFANLIVSDSMLLSGDIPGKPGELVRHLKPCGGVICLGAPAGAPGEAGKLSGHDVQKWFDQLQLGKSRISQTNGVWVSIERSRLPGAGQWTHQYAEPGNTACSDDRIVAGPLGLLWYGEPGPAPMVNRHNAAAAPLVVNGRTFIQGENVVMAYDSYNGVKLWERKIPGAMRTSLKKYECSNLAASEDSFFVAVQDKCLRLDAETGETRATYRLPPESEGERPKWGYLAYAAGIIYGTSTTNRGVSSSVFAIDTADNATLWSHSGKNIINLTISIGDGWVFFIDSSITPEQRAELLKQDKSHLKNLTAEAAKKAEAAMKKIDARLAVALDARTGGEIWAKAVDVTDCSNIGIGGGQLSTMYRDGVVILCGANANGHYWRQFLKGDFSQRRLVALSAKTGSVLWAKDANYRHRPVIVGDSVVAEPWAFDLKTGRERMRNHPVTGEEETWKVFRPGHHCGAVSACAQMLFMRSGFTSYYDLHDDSGIRHFAGHRLGCWINAIPADGLALMPEASAGCVCMFPIVCSIALEPRPDYDRWGIYSTGGANTPVRHMALNLGAAGDRRDAAGTLWFGYPRPGLPGDRAAMGITFPLKTEFVEKGGYERRSNDGSPVSGTDAPWVYTSCARGLKRCVVPLLSDGDKPAEYTVRLYFTDFDNAEAGKRVFDVKMQGKVVMANVDIAKQAEGAGKAVIREVAGIAVTRDLEIELVGKGAGAGGMPLLCGVEVVRETKVADAGK